MNEEKIKELFANEDFVTDLFKSESFEVAQKKLADKDVEVSVEDLKDAYKLLQKRQNGELDDEELESVAGGGTGIVLIAIICGFLGFETGSYCYTNC